MSIFITGANGFVGSHLTRTILRHNEKITILQQPGTNLGPIEDISSQLQIIEADIKDTETISEALANDRPQITIHLAWYVEPGKYLESRENISMRDNTVKLAGALEKIGCKRFIGAGTSFEYSLEKMPLSEKTQIDPQTVYAKAKYDVYASLKELCSKQFMEFAWVRLFYMYGPGEYKERLVPHVIRQFLQDKSVQLTSGSKIRDYLYIEDVADAIWAVADSNHTGAFNIASGVKLNLQGLITAIENVTGKTGLAEFDAHQDRSFDPEEVLADITRLKEETGWSPKHTLEEGIKKCVEYWEKAGI